MQQRSNAAYDMSRFETVDEPLIQKVPTRIKAVKPLNIAKIIFYMLIIIALLCALIYGRVVQSEVDAKLTASTNALAELKAENSRLQIKMESLVSIDKIEEIAGNELGLNKVSNQQIEYVNISKDNKITVSGSQTILDKISNWFNK
ncbi:MAG: hypothetical protein RR497_03480 [Oscillospiraceae bacterium]